MGSDIAAAAAAAVRSALPLHSDAFALPSHKPVGLVVIDEIHGFCSVGCGNLAPTRPDHHISRMVSETHKLALEFSARDWPIIAFIDTHEPDKPEPPYPPHCLRGSGEDELVEELQWLNHDKNVVIMRKDCINGFIAGFQPDGSNTVVDWVKKNNVQIMIVVGICTDICVLDFVVTVLSARNHGILSPLEEVLVYTDGCSTYDLPTDIAKEIGALPHPQELAHHIGLYMANSRGARLVHSLTFPLIDASSL